MNNYSSSRMLGAVAALGAATVATQADAAIVFFDFTSNVNSAIPFNIDGIYLNVVTGATGTSGAGLGNVWDINPYFTGTTAPPASFAAFAPTTGDLNRALIGVTGVGASALTLGTAIGPGGAFVTGANSGSAFHASGGYLGFRFTNEATGAINYGWAQFTSTGANPPTAGSIRLVGYAYENAGLSINAGDTGVIPEPTTVVTLGALAMGALGLRQWRRRKAA